LSVLTVFDGKGWVLLAAIELPASKTEVMVARVDTFTSATLSTSLKYAAIIGFTPLSAIACYLSASICRR